MVEYFLAESRNFLEPLFVSASSQEKENHHFCPWIFLKIKHIIIDILLILSFTICDSTLQKYIHKQPFVKGIHFIHLYMW